MVHITPEPEYPLIFLAGMPLPGKALDHAERSWHDCGKRRRTALWRRDRLGVDAWRIPRVQDSVSRWTARRHGGR